MKAELPRFSAKSESHKELIQSILDNDITLVHGPAGTGKTALTIQTYLNLLTEKKIRKIVVVRLIADTFDEHLGALPGEITDKMHNFLGPILDNLRQIRTESQIQHLLNLKQLEVIPVSQVRGRSFVDTAIMVEEAQNMSSSMIFAILTRIGERSKIVVNGDTQQNDFSHRRSDGVSFASAILQDIPGAKVIEFKEENIVRHPIIKHLIKKRRELGI